MKQGKFVLILIMGILCSGLCGSTSCYKADVLLENEPEDTGSSIFQDEDDEPEEMTFEDSPFRSVMDLYDINDLGKNKLVTAGHSLVTTLTNQTYGGYTCSATAAMTIVGNDLYCVRTASQKDSSNPRKLPVVLHIIKNFATNPKEQYVILETQGGNHYIAAHANGLSHYENNNGEITFFLATGNETQASAGSDASKQNIIGSQIVCFGTDGKIFKKYTYTKKIHSVNYVGGTDKEKYFLLNKGTGGTAFYNYDYVKEDGNKLEKIKTCRFRVLKENVDGTYVRLYNSGNDAYYDIKAKKMYLTLFLRESGASITKNAIVEYDMEKIDDMTMEEYEPIKVIQADAIGEVKFEIEGIGIYGTKKYICTNIVKTKGIEGPDGIYYIYKKSAK